MLNIRLKLLSDNNVILGKCDGLETEVFMPAIIDGRISIVNVIPQRRCNCISTVHLVAKKTLPGRVEASPSDTLSNWKVPVSTQKRKHSAENEPLAESTPAQLNAIHRNAKEHTMNVTYPTPEPMRHALAEVNSSFTMPIRRNQKRLQFSDFESDKSGVPIQSPSPAIHGATAEDNETPICSSYALDLPKTPPVARHANYVNNTLEHIESPSGVEWRKVITPVRTYARRKHPLHKNVQPLTNVVPIHHLENATMAPPSTHIIVRKRRKLILDQSSTISPKSFKQQLKTDPVSGQELRLSNKNFIEGLSREPAFKLLTTLSARSKCIAKRLRDQFRSRCVNKGSSTYPKYKKLCAVPPLENNIDLGTQNTDNFTANWNTELKSDVNCRQQLHLKHSRAFTVQISSSSSSSQASARAFTQTTVQMSSSSSSNQSSRCMLVSHLASSTPMTPD